ncbi:MAG: uxaA [Eubacterium sp.]|nr:uxaA [Eubacterium sp.]
MDKVKALKIHPKDNVAVVLQEIKKGGTVEFEGKFISTLEDIPAGHKVAITDISESDNIIKYGFPIGHATSSMTAGRHVHTHNLSTNLGELLEYNYSPELFACGRTAEPDSFQGYRRQDGKVGIRNEIWIVNTVGCVNKTSELLASEANTRFKGIVDGVYAFPHPYGCSQMGEDQENTQKILAGMVMHPNAGGVLVLGLGCENNNVDEFKKILGRYDSKRVKVLAAQETEDEFEEGLKLISQLVEYAGSFRRTLQPLSKLIVGLKCGGSDAFSGITANPLVGMFSDKLLCQGGTTILTEVPEMFGAETLLMNRCMNEKVFNDTVRLINNFKDYYIQHKQVIYDNPSPGNKKGGISTLEEKSLGCTQKGGTGNVTSVLEYGEQVRERGLNLLQGPGNDIVAVTALMAAGAQLILFTTGRGTPLGAPVPTVKISTNTELSDRKKNWIDFNAGKILNGSSMSQVAEDMYHYVIKLASGELFTKNEENGYREIAIFKNGVTL